MRRIHGLALAGRIDCEGLAERSIALDLRALSAVTSQQALLPSFCPSGRQIPGICVFDVICLLHFAGFLPVERQIPGSFFARPLLSSFRLPLFCRLSATFCHHISLSSRVDRRLLHENLGSSARLRRTKWSKRRVTNPQTFYPGNASRPCPCPRSGVGTPLVDGQPGRPRAFESSCCSPQSDVGAALLWMSTFYRRRNRALDRRTRPAHFGSADK